MSYIRFGAMIATSTVVMFVLMYLNTYAWEHVFFSETRTYMAILMGASMAVIMLSYMLGMYSNTKANIAIFVGSVLVFALTLWLVRSQATVGQVSYMRAMIPHHSIAIMTSERAQITDPRVRKLADEIIAAQQREIAEMRFLIAELEEGGEAIPQAVPESEEAPEVVSFTEALRTVVIAAVDPEPLEDAETADVLGPGPGCMFRRTRESPPIVVARAPSDAAAPAEGVMKLHGKLVRLRAESGADVPALAAGATFAAEGVRMTVRPLADGEGAVAGVLERSDAELVFELDQGLTVGYRGFYGCDL